MTSSEPGGFLVKAFLATPTMHIKSLFTTAWLCLPIVPKKSLHPTGFELGKTPEGSF
jgi:hypothetical protein